MNDDRGLIVPGAKTIPIRLAGAWRGHDWYGIVSADEELAGVLLVRDGGGLNWTRSRRTGLEGLLFQFRAGSDPAGGKVWYSVELGSAMCWGRVGGPRIEAFAAGDPNWTPRTGLVTTILINPGIGSPLQIGVLALARSDVRFGRKHILRL